MSTAPDNATATHATHESPGAHAPGPACAQQAHDGGTAHDERIAPQTPRAADEQPADTAAGACPGRLRRRLRRMKPATLGAAAVTLSLVIAVTGVAASFDVFGEDGTEQTVTTSQQANGSTDASDEKASTGDDASDDASGAVSSAGEAADDDGDATAATADEGTSSSDSSSTADGSSSAGSSSGGASSGSTASGSTSSGSASTSDFASSSAGSSGSSSSASSSGSSSGTSTGSASSSSSDASDTSSDASSAGNTICVSIYIDSSRAASYGYASSMGSGTLTLAEGSTVYDALCALGVSVSGTSTYVSAIGGLAEFDCGSGSGWMYSVDGVYPNKACGKYVLSGGESIVWVYTCDLGNDL